MGAATLWSVSASRPRSRRLRGAGLLVGALLPTALIAPGSPGGSGPGAAAVRLTADHSRGSGDRTSVEPDTKARPSARTVTVALSGDILVHDTVWAAAASAARRQGRPGMDFRPLLAPLRPLVSRADLALCHLETPLAPAGGPYASYPLFSAPPQVAAALAWVGYDGCSTASNHSVDQGFAGVGRTLAELDRVGLTHTGTARSRAEAGRIGTFDVHGIEIAWLSYTYGTNGMPVDADNPWSVNLIAAERIERDARRARAAGAEAVLVALHWGDEYSHTPSAFQRDLADRLSRDPDITAIYGHHAHVVQPIERVHGTWVVYGLGNLLAGQGTTAPGVNDGMVAILTLRQRGDRPVRVLRPAYHPTHIDPTGPFGEFRVYDVGRALAGRVGPGARAELRASLAATRAVVG